MDTMILTLQREDKNSERKKNAMKFSKIESSEMKTKNKTEESEHFKN